MEEENVTNNDQREETTNDLGDLQAKLEELQLELANEKNRHLRTRADFDNYRKRIERDTETSRLQIKKEILVDLLTFLDYFEQARRQLRDPAAAEGLVIMARQFSELLQKHGVRPVECIGLPFDPEAQEGIGYVVTEECPEGCVAEEVCTGYMLGDVLLKPARVMVAKKE
jgi:molecular chaperone GrpE